MENRDGEVAAVLGILTDHIGRENAIGMGELYSRAFGKKWQHRINDTRKLRKIVTQLRFEGRAIGAVCGSTGGGYYLARSRSELKDYFDRVEHEALKRLLMVSRMKKISLPERMNQLSLELGERGEEL